MARQTRVRGAKLRTNGASVRHVILLVDRRSDCRRKISQLQMLRVAEVSERSCPWRADRPVIVAGLPDRGIGQQPSSSDQTTGLGEGGAAERVHGGGLGCFYRL